MNHQTLISVSKRTALSAALCLALGAGAQATTMSSSTFTMYSSAGSVVGTPDTTVTGAIGGQTFSVASTTTFFGNVWTAHGGTTFGPGTYTFNSIEGGKYTNVIINAGQVGGHILFNWATTKNIDVVMAWDITYDKSGDTIYTSTDVTAGPGTGTNTPITAPDSIPGLRMIDGAFVGFHANFSFMIPPIFTITLTKAAIILDAGSTTVSTNLSATNYTFTWTANSDAAIQAAMTSANDSPSITFTTTGLTAAQDYTVSVTATRKSDSTKTARADITVTPITLSPPLSNANDSDGDGIGDATETVADSTGNGIPDFLDSANLTTKELALDTSKGSTGLIMKSDSGVLSLGDKAIAVGTSNLMNGILKWPAIVTAKEIGTTDTEVTSPCTGGCFDFKVTGLTKGATAKVVLPLSTQLSSYPVYRKFVHRKTPPWNGFVIDAHNSISSAAALSSNPITCPAPGSAAYSKVGLTPGDYCIQLTIQDGGPNDADGTTPNGTIVDPGGVATSGEHTLGANVPSGCSMSTVPVDPSQRADWWLVAGFFVVLGWLRGMRRRKAHTA